MNTILAPSLLSSDFLKLQQELLSIEDSGATWIHLDVMDGQFVPNFFLSPKIIADIRRGTPLFLDTHLMIEEPQRYIESFIQAGSDSLTIHFEACKDCLSCLSSIKEQGCLAGLSIIPETPVQAIVPYLAMVDLVLVMTIHPGIPGQAFMDDMLEKVRQLQAIRKEKGYRYRISVDGGITDITALSAIHAGADVLVTGTSFFASPDRKAFVDNILRRS